MGDLLTGCNSVSSRKEVITTSTGKEYIVERLENDSPRTGTPLSVILIEEEEVL
ncbi:hypothetical protein [Methanosarcina sp.]|uniref:hypothetical protein n=1 Tax=Methanosarcina sp. TaxID=2213 RepID=UPI002D1FAAEB|nr:hypothetical protein [Methanosarcina sp.]